MHDLWHNMRLILIQTGLMRVCLVSCVTWQKSQTRTGLHFFTVRFSGQIWIFSHGWCLLIVFIPIAHFCSNYFANLVMFLCQGLFLNNPSCSPTLYINDLGLFSLKTEITIFSSNNNNNNMVFWISQVALLLRMCTPNRHARNFVNINFR